jgi:hypothetical protein
VCWTDGQTTTTTTTTTMAMKTIKENVGISCHRKGTPNEQKKSDVRDSEVRQELTQGNAHDLF